MREIKNRNGTRICPSTLQRCGKTRLINLATTLIKVNDRTRDVQCPYLWGATNLTTNMLLPRHHFAILLIGLGLGLLAAFLGIFLQKSWDDATEKLRHETGLLFINAVRGIESEVFDRIIVQQLGQGSDTTLRVTLHLPARRDTTQIRTFIQERNTVIRSKKTDDSLHKTLFRTDIKTSTDPNDPNMVGSLSLIIGLDGSENDHNFRAKPDSGAFLRRINTNFAQAIQQSGLMIQWAITPVQTDTMVGRIPIGTYTDLASGDRVEAVIWGLSGYLWSKIRILVLFSLLLFACVALAFLFVFQSFQQQRRLTEIKNEFIRNMTHELKTPIATVGVAIEALQNFNALHDPARTQEYLGIAQLEINRLALLVDKVLRMSLFEHATPSLQRQSFDLKILVEEVLSTLKLQFEKYGASVEFQAIGPDFVLRGDRLHLASVVYNLLDNALKYSIVSPKITICILSATHQITLQVRDEGRGIPLVYQKRVFEQFFRVPTGDVHDVKGHGLGLTYVAGVVRLHGGRIEVESEDGKYTCFWVHFPAVKH